VRKLYTLTVAEEATYNPPTLKTGVVFVEGQVEPDLVMQVLDDDNWLRVGYIPTPTTRIGWFCYHVIHGLWMHYPVWKVLLYAIFESKLQKGAV